MFCSPRRMLLGIVASISSSLLLAPAPALAQQEFLIRYAGIQGPTDAATKAMFRFKDEVEQNSKGRIKVQIYYQTQLAGGNTIDQLRFLKLGAIEMNNVGFAQMSQDSPDFGAVTLPFLFPDTKTAATALRLDGPASTILSAGAAKNGLKLMGYHLLGLRNLLMAKKPIRTLAELKGLKLRVVQGQVPLATYRALGANPVPMDFAEVPAGMTQGVIDGTDLPVTSVVSVSAFAYGHFYTILRSYLEAQVVMMNQTFFNKLPPDLQSIVMVAVRNSCDFELAQNATDEAAAIDVLKAKGVQVIDLPPQDLELARTGVQGVYSELGSRFSPGLVSALQDRH